METREQRRAIYEKRMLIQDLIGDARLWPRRIRRQFWKMNIKHFERILTAALVYVKGLNPELFLEWAFLMRLCRDVSVYAHFRAFFPIVTDRMHNMLEMTAVNI